MRMVPTLYTTKGKPAVLKKVRAETQHVMPPLKGLSQATKFTPTDNETAVYLSNFNVEEDCISCRAGYIKTATRGTAPVWCLIPWYGVPNSLAAASNGELWNAQNGSRLKGGFSSNDWHWTSFSNLGEYDYTVMVNGADGVWSWNGSLNDDLYGDIAVTNLTSANPAVVTVAAGDLAKFSVGQIVAVSGATGPGTVKANGYRTVTAKGASTITLSVDTTGGTTQTSGVKINPTSGIMKEPIVEPITEPWVSVQTFNCVVAHMNRLIFTDKSNLAFYYLPIQQKSGEVKVFPLNAVFRRGGSIRAMYTWTIDGGAGLNDMLVLFSSNGECVIYSGTDPATNFKLEGIFRFDAPMSKHAIAQYGGELYVQISTGLVPMSTMLRAETERLGQSEKSVTTMFFKNSVQFRSDQGWQVFLNPSSGRMFCNIPQGAPNRYRQFIRHMPKAIWSIYDNLPARCWSWLDPNVYFADDSGNVYEMHPAHRSDDNKPILVDVLMAWNNFKTPLWKQFTGIKTYMTSDGAPQPIIDIKTEFDFSAGYNTPNVDDEPPGAEWDIATWDVDYWAAGDRAVTVFNGVAGKGCVGAIRLTTKVFDASFSVNGWEVVYEKGSWIL